MWLVTTWLLVISCLLATGQVASPENNKTAISTDEYSVYAVVVMQVFWKADTRIALVQGNTLAVELNPQFLSYLYGHFPTLEKTTVADLRDKPQMALQLRFPLNRDYRIVEESMVSFGETVGGRPDYPNSTGVLSLSRVGVNSDNTQALMYVRQHCGSLCGHDVWVLLSKQQDGRWQVTRKLITGAS
jgi:hypothetical protein